MNSSREPNLSQNSKTHTKHIHA